MPRREVSSRAVAASAAVIALLLSGCAPELVSCDMRAAHHVCVQGAPADLNLAGCRQQGGVLSDDPCPYGSARLSVTCVVRGTAAAFYDPMTDADAAAVCAQLGGRLTR
jgi:hypothetical protein